MKKSTRLAINAKIGTVVTDLRYEWVLAGGTIERLRELLGHSTVLVTERYAHLRPDAFGSRERARVAVDLSAPTGKVLPLEPAAVQTGASWARPMEADAKKTG